jgi:hypothetical protein
MLFFVARGEPLLERRFDSKRPTIRWQPMASMATTAPSIANMSSSAGMATISLDFSATASHPRTSRCRAAKAETIWIGYLKFLQAGTARGLAVDGDDVAGTLSSVAT